MRVLHLKSEIAQQELSDLGLGGYSGTNFNKPNPKSAIENRKSSSGEGGFLLHGE